MFRSFRYLIFWSLIGYWALAIGNLSNAVAAYDPLSVPNNRYGVHILDPSELQSAAQLVNSSGGDWGYVTVPIRADDRDQAKWQAFFQNAGKYRLIPILRLTTYFDSKHWVAPTIYDLIDFANFLVDMPWPIQNRYIILFNEPNHSKEWGGQVDPAAYASLLVEAKEIFKTRSADFFLLTAGLDMSAPSNHTSLNALEFYRRMAGSQPRWWDFIDGLSFHAYPNPGFNSPFNSRSRYGIASYRHELKYLPKKLPLFITETGSLSLQTFYPTAFKQVWTEPEITAITPFLLFAAAGDFEPFSLLDSNRSPRPHYLEILNQPKIAGSPLLSNPRPPANPVSPAGNQPAPDSGLNSLISKFKRIFSKALPSITIGKTKIPVEVADTPPKRAQGLSDRDFLPPGTGMLFVFPKAGIYSFWMKDMRFALDFIWINDSKVVQISTNIPPPDKYGSNMPVVTPGSPVTHVLEVPAGFVSANKLAVGDSVVLNLP